MMKKKLFLTTLLMATALMPATAYDYLAFATTDGTVTTVSATSVALTLAGGNLTATDADGTHTFALTALAKMYFTDTKSGDPSAIEQVAADGPLGAVTVYGVDGILRGGYQSLAAARAALPAGAYVVKTQDANLKIVVK